MAIPKADHSKAVALLRKYIKQIERTTTGKLHACTGIPIRTITDMRSKKCKKRRFDLRFVVAIAIGLHMTPDHATEYLGYCGYRLREDDPEEYYYGLLLHRCGRISVRASNAFLRDEGQEPLTDL